MARIHHRYAVIGGRRLFYREAGPADAPVLVLLHGFPASSFMFRGLIPLLADRWRTIAPDHLGSGLSEAPPVTEFEYTFDALAGLTADLLGRLGVDRFAVYLHGFGAPVGWRLALRHPAAVTAVITQNADAYQVGVPPEVAPAFTRRLYLTGVPDQTLVDPSAWEHDHALLSRPGRDLIQLRLFAEHAGNASLYPAVHRYFRERQVPLLAVWGRGDRAVPPAGALAFARDLPAAGIHLLDGGHFLLESALDETVPLIRAFLTANL